MELWQELLLLAAVAFVIGLLFLLASHEPSSNKVIDKPQRFIETRTNHVQKQMAYREARLRQEDQIKNEPVREERRLQLEELTHENLLTADQLIKQTNDLNLHLTGEAKKRSVSLSGLDIIRAEEEKVQLELDKASLMVKIKADEAREMAQVEVEKATELASLTVQTILTERMIDKKIISKLQDSLFEQIDKIEKIKALPDSDGKIQKLQLATTILQGWTNDLYELTGQRQRGNVPGDDGPEVRGLGASEQSPADTSETEEED